jgi:hypothetical protein
VNAAGRDDFSEMGQRRRSERNALIKYLGTLLFEMPLTVGIRDDSQIV